MQIVCPFLDYMSFKKITTVTHFFFPLYLVTKNKLMPDI